MDMNKSEWRARNEKMKVMVGLSIAGIAMLGLALFTMGGVASFSEIVFVVLTIILVIGVTAIIINKSKEVKKGLPAEDELSKKISWRAGAYSYFATIWIAIAIMWYNTLGVDKLGLYELSTVEIVGVIVLVSGVIYISLAMLFNRRGGF
jgi:peptidoglycan/LPS O-acetylase OafA/YrhL